MFWRPCRCSKRLLNPIRRDYNILSLSCYSFGRRHVSRFGKTCVYFKEKQRWNPASVGNGPGSYWGSGHHIHTSHVAILCYQPYHILFNGQVKINLYALLFSTTFACINLIFIRWGEQQSLKATSSKLVSKPSQVINR
jgi:hypothetical protein